jgi:molecular chaperone GrpE (heat shock protein)
VLHQPLLVLRVDKVLMVQIQQLLVLKVVKDQLEYKELLEQTQQELKDFKEFKELLEQTQQELKDFKEFKEVLVRTQLLPALQALQVVLEHQTCMRLQWISMLEQLILLHLLM